MTVPERRIVMGSRDLCFGNPANGQERQGIVLIQFTDGGQTALCPLKTFDGLCSLRPDAPLPCIQERKNPNGPIEVEISAGHILWLPETNIVEDFPSSPRPVHITDQQGKIFTDLLLHPGIVRGPADLLPGYDERTPLAYTSRLRERLGDRNGEIIKTVRGNGIRLGP